MAKGKNNKKTGNRSDAGRGGGAGARVAVEDEVAARAGVHPSGVIQSHRVSSKLSKKPRKSIAKTRLHRLARKSLSSC